MTGVRSAELRHPVPSPAGDSARGGMRQVPPGRVYTARYNDSFPANEANLPPYWMDPTEVTNSMYAGFVRATGYPAPETWHGGWYPKGQEAHPVTGVSLVDALFYCAWRGVRLPTWDEWHRAAHPSDGRRYPWGDEADPKAFACDVPLRPVGQFPKSAGRYGLHDIIGNAWEWTMTPLRRERDGSIIQGSALLLGGGTLSLDDCGHFADEPASDPLSSPAGGMSFDGPLMMFWDEREGLPNVGANAKMWGATITSRRFSYISGGGGTIMLGMGGGLPRTYPRLCILVGDISLRCECIGFRCAAH